MVGGEWWREWGRDVGHMEMLILMNINDVRRG